MAASKGPKQLATGPLVRNFILNSAQCTVANNAQPDEEARWIKLVK